MNQNNIEQILQTLNPEQKRAALHSGGPAVIFAGAGSGKTRVIAARIGILLEKSIIPSQILAVTFTNKASKEMKDRLSRQSKLGTKVHVGTFHSSCVRWLREFATELGFTSNFTIYDEKDSLSVIKTLMKDLNLTMDNTPPKSYVQMIANVKTLGWTPYDFEQKFSNYNKKFPPLSTQVYKKYQNHLINCNAMDFADLIMNTLVLLRTNTRIKEILSNRYHHILVDEYQDTNPVQFALIRNISGPHTQLFVVGDDDQSIYSWRGARPEHIINFKEFFPNSTEIKLERNYRSTKNIVDAATALISTNVNRSSKILWTDNLPGNKINYVREYDSESEAWWVIEDIKKNKNTIESKDTAILYRTNAQSRQLEDVLVKNNIEYRIYGSLRFYDRAEIKDIICYLRLIINPDDDVALKRIINIPTRGIGKKTIEDLETQALKKELSIISIIKEQGLLKKDRKTEKLTKFITLITTIKNNLQEQGLEKIISLIVEGIGYKEYIHKKHEQQANDKINNIMELDNVLYEFCQKNPNANLANWIKEISLSSKQSNESDTGISIMTLHAAKGLEFDKVYIVGLEDGLIPHQNSLDSKDNIEEEKRLLYVGITRAKKDLCLTSAIRRRMANKFVKYDPSRFLKEIPSQLFAQKTFEHLKESNNSNILNISIGQKIFHPSYGSGIVKKIDNDFGSIKGTVDFKQVGLRRMSIESLQSLTKRSY